MLNAAQQDAVVATIQGVEERVRAIRAMIQAPELCAAILRELAGAEAGLNDVSATVLRMHVETCVPEGVRTSDEEGRTRLSELVDIFDRFAK